MPYGTSASHHVKTLWSLSNLSFFLTQRGQSAVSYIGFCHPPGLSTLSLAKLVPPGPRSSSLSHIRHVLQCTPTLPPGTEPECGAEEVRRAPSGSFLYRPQGPTPPAKHRKTHSFSCSSLQKKNRGKVKVCGYMWSGKTPFCLKKNSPPTF